MGSDKTTSRTEKDTDLVDRLIGWHHYKTTVSDGKETVVGLGRTPEQSEKRASEKWAEFPPLKPYRPTGSWNVASRKTEPRSLRRGKRLHERLEKNWKETAEGEVTPEKRITKPSGRKGRIDIFVKADATYAAIVEIKSSLWDRMSLQALRRNVKRQASQIWDYVESQLRSGKDVTPGVVFPKRPKDRDRMNLIEQLFEEQGISVVWQDETIPERKTRS